MLKYCLKEKKYNLHLNNKNKLNVCIRKILFTGVTYEFEWLKVINILQILLKIDIQTTGVIEEMRSCFTIFSEKYLCNFKKVFYLSISC